MSVKSTAIKSSAVIASSPAKIGNGKTIQRKTETGLSTLPSVQRKEGAGSWLHTQPQKAVNSKPLIQPKVKIHASNDHYEKEADHVADKVVSNQTASSTKITSTSGSNNTQRKVNESVNTGIQTKTNNLGSPGRLGSGDNSPPMPDIYTTHPLTAVLTNQSTRGSPLPAPARTQMERSMGANFGNVRIHTGQTSHDANVSIGARAFTHGSDIYFANGQFNPNTKTGQHLLAHELTHTIQQGASATNRGSVTILQRNLDNTSPSGASSFFSDSRGPPLQTKSNETTIQCSLVDTAVSRIGELLNDLPSVTDGLEGVKQWLMQKARRFASFIPGYTALGVVMGQDPITGAHIERNGRNFINAALDIIPFGSLLKQKLEELGAIDRAAAWIDQQLETLSGITANIRNEFTVAWNALGLTSILDGPLNVLRNFGDIFERGINSLISFAERAASELLSIVKQFLLTQVVDFIKNHTNAYELLKVIIGHDPVTEEHVDRNGTNILNALLELGGEQGREQRRQMQDTGTFQKAADWIDRGIAVFGNLYQTIRDNFGLIWNAVSIESLMHPVDTFNRLYEKFAEPVRQVLNFVAEALEAILGLIKEVLLRRLSAWARTVRGYSLVTVLIGKDPFTNEVVPRSVPNIICGFMSLMEGGEEQYRQMEESGAIARTTQRINAAIARLNMTPATVLQLFVDLWNSFSFNDLVHPVAAFQRIIDRFGEPIARLIAFVIEIVKIVIHVILEVMNFPFDLINNIINRAMAAFERIKRDPVGFLKNLLRAIKQGFIQFFSHIGTHLLSGVIGWLMSELRDANVPVPADFTLRGIIAWVLQVLGISMEAIWQKLAAHPRIGPERVARIRGMINTLEGVWTFIKDVQQRGMAAIWDKIQEQLSNLWNTILDSVKNWIMERVVSQVTARLLSMLDPTGIMAVINSAIAIYRAVQSFIRYLRQMLEIVNSFVNGVADIAEGNITTAANYLERTMASAMPIVIGFLANQVGLSGIGRRIGEMITSVRQMVDRALTWLVNKAVDTGMALLDRAMALGRSAAGAVLGWLGLRKQFNTRNGESHQLYFEQRGGRSELMVASNPTTLRNFVTSIRFPPNRPPRGDVLNDQQLAINFLDRIEVLTHAPPAGMTEEQRTAEIRGKMQIVSETVARLMMVAGGTVRSSTQPVFAGTYGDFARGMRVEIVGRPASAGSDASATGTMWNKLIKRRSAGGGQVGSYYIRGHLLSQLLGGDGGTWLNLTPLTQAANQEHESRIELPLKRRVDANADHAFIYVVNPSYGRSAPDITVTNSINAHPTWTASQKQNALDITQTEQYVPTALVCTIQEIDPISGEEIPSDISGTHTVNNPITQNIPGYIVQTKLKTENSSGPHEKEADRIADKVVANKKISPATISKINSSNIPQQSASANNKQQAGNPANALIAKPDTRGSPLPASTKTQMEKHIGADFSNVRIHTSEESNKTNNVIGSRAFTQGANIHFAKGEFNPNTKEGKHLLAHELTHTVQQGAAPHKEVSAAKDKKTNENQTTGTTEHPATTTSFKSKTVHETKTGGKAITDKKKTGNVDKSADKTAGGSPKPKPGIVAVNTTSQVQGKAGSKNMGDAPVTGSVSAAIVDEDRPLSSISNYTPTQIGKGFGVIQQKTSTAVAKKAKDTVSNMPKIPLAAGSAYGDPILKQNKGTKKGTAAKDINGLDGKEGFEAPQLPETVVPEVPINKPVILPSSGGENKDEVDAAKADDTLDNVTLDAEGIPSSFDENPEVQLTGESDPNNMDEAMNEQSQEINKEKTDAAKEISHDYGENNVIKKPGKGKINSKKKIKPVAFTIRRLSKNNTYPAAFETKAAAYSGGDPYKKMNAETSKYYTAKDKEEGRMDDADLQSREQIDEQAQLSKNGQVGAQRKVLQQVGDKRTQWSNELNDTEKSFYDSSMSLKTGFRESVNTEKKNGDEKIKSEIDKANEEADKKHQKANEDVEKEKKKKKEESSGFWGWLRDKASALIDALKSFVNWVFDELRKAVKWIFDKLKKLIIGFLEIIHKAVVGLIKGFGAMLKGFASIALAAFPETRDRVVREIDGAVNSAVEATDAAFEKFEQAVSDIIDALADIVDSVLGFIQDITNIAFDILKTIVVGLLYVLEFLTNIEKMYALFKKMIDGFMYLWDHPEVIEQKAKEFLEPYVLNSKSEAPAQVTTALNKLGLGISKHITGVMNYLKPNLDRLAGNWWGEAKKMIWFLIWPFADGSPLWEDAPKLWHLLPQIWNDFWHGDFSKCIDGCLEWMQALNSVIGAFAGWIVIGGVIVGFIIGAFFGGVGAIPGAGAGFEAGVAIGEGIMFSMIATETAVIGKAVYDLSVTTDDGVTSTPAPPKEKQEAKQESSTGQPESNGPTMRQSGDVKTGRDRIEFAYQRIANSGLALGIMVALILLGAIGGKIAQAIIGGIKKIASFVGELLPEVVTDSLGKLGSAVKESKPGQILKDAAEDFNAGRKDMKSKIDGVKQKIGLKGKSEPKEKAPKPDEPTKGNDPSNLKEKPKPKDPMEGTSGKNEEPTPDKPMVHDDGELIVDETKSKDGSRTLEQTAEGECLVCSSPCKEIKKKYETELRRKANKGIEKELDDIRDSKLSTKEKSQKYKDIEQRLAEARKADNKLVAGSEPHKRQRWEDYQLDNPDKYPKIKDQYDPKWSDQYDQVIENGKQGSAFEKDVLSRKRLKKNNQILMDPQGNGEGFIPDSIKGNPDTVKWGDNLDMVEVKGWQDWSDLSDSNVDKMLDYVSTHPDSSLEIVFTSDHPISGKPTHVSQPFLDRIAEMKAQGLKVKITFFPK